MLLFAYICVIVGTIFIILGFSNKTKHHKRGEKTATGKVEEFSLIDFNGLVGKKYKAIIKAGLKKYTIESYSMPWLKEDEEVLVQITGKQKILGNERLNNRAKIELFLGALLIVFPFVLFFAK